MFVLNEHYFQSIQNSYGIDNIVDLKISRAQQTLSRNLPKSINSKMHCTRNGEDQIFIVTSTNTDYKCNIQALPNEDLFAGDIIEFDDEHWLVISVNQSNPIQYIGTAWLCNGYFKWQNKDSKIYGAWGVLDNGSYTTTINGNNVVQYPDKQFRMYLPYDEHSKYMYIDKRLATNTTYDSRGNEILETVSITGRNVITQNYGSNSHIIVLDVRSSQFNPSSDNVSLMICDYIEQSESITCNIIGKKRVRINSSAKYTVADLSLPLKGEWVNSLGFQSTVDDQYTVYIPNNENLIGSKFDIQYIAEGKILATITVEVV